jgi:hypothetical protein
VGATNVIRDVARTGHPSFSINGIQKVISRVLTGISASLLVTVGHYSRFFRRSD